MAAKFTLPHLTKQQQQMLAAAVICTGAFGYIYFAYFWNPISAKIKDRNAKIEDIEKNIDRAKTQASRLPRIEKELEVLNQQASEAEKRLPKTKDVPTIIETISRIARNNHIDLVTFSPGNPAPRQYFIEVPYSLSVTGTFHDIGKFFAGIALEERIFNIRDVQFAKGGRGGTLAIQFTLVSYQYKG